MKIVIYVCIYWCPIKLSSPIDFLFSSDSRHIECVGASLGDKNPLEELELGKYDILVNQYPTKGELFYRTADTINEIGGLSMHKITHNSQLNTFIGHQ